MKPFPQNKAIYLIDLTRIISEIECDQFSFCITAIRQQRQENQHHDSAGDGYFAGAKVAAADEMPII
ncbi:hypothetical protein [Pantoea vagans]|uniref:hypothetical protein n=1 Tax=Pantoea vagans TaxID=470934 RepID=UPI0028EBEED5|nr:hypothetical protein [Pantoea vagans]